MPVGDVIYTNTPIQAPGKPIQDVQYFWEAFPAGSGRQDRTTYMFTYIDADPRRCAPAIQRGQGDEPAVAMGLAERQFGNASILNV